MCDSDQNFPESTPIMGICISKTVAMQALKPVTIESGSQVLRRGQEQARTSFTGTHFVLDRAKYHIMVAPETRPMRKSFRKDAFIDAVNRWGGTPDNRAIVRATMKTWPLLFAECELKAPPPIYQAQELQPKLVFVLVCV